MPSSYSKYQQQQSPQDNRSGNRNTTSTNAFNLEAPSNRTSNAELSERRSSTTSGIHGTLNPKEIELLNSRDGGRNKDKNDNNNSNSDDDQQHHRTTRAGVIDDKNGLPAIHNNNSKKSVSTIRVDQAGNTDGRRSSRLTKEALSSLGSMKGERNNNEDEDEEVVVGGYTAKQRAERRKSKIQEEQALEKKRSFRTQQDDTFGYNSRSNNNNNSRSVRGGAESAILPTHLRNSNGVPPSVSSSSQQYAQTPAPQTRSASNNNNNEGSRTTNAKTSNTAADLGPFKQSINHNPQKSREQQNGSRNNNSATENNNNNNNDDDEADRQSVSGASEGHMSRGGGSSSGTGDEGQIEPLLQIMMDIMHKADVEALREFNNKSGSSTPGSNSQSLTPKSMSLGGGVASGDPLVAPKIRTHAQLFKLALSNENYIFSQLNRVSSRGLVIADPVASNIVWVNEAAERLFGRLDLVGSKLESLMPDELAVRHAGIIASYRERYMKEFAKTGCAPDSRLLDIVKPRRFGVISHVGGRPQLRRVDAFVRSLRMQDEPLDEPSRLMSLEAIDVEDFHVNAGNSQIFSAALDNVSDAIIVANFDGHIQYINKAAELLAGYPLAALKAIRATVNIFLPNEFVNQHEGYLQHFRQGRKAATAAMTAKSHETVVSRRVEMKTAFGREEIILRVDVAYDKLIAYLKSTKEFIPREEFANERLKLLLPSSIVKLLRGATDVSDITSYFWEFDNRTVMFTDVAGFSNWAKNRPVKAVHDRMQPMFSEFEAIIQAFGGELIHRIGDAVMVIFGFNGEERHHARYALGCAVELQQWSLSNGFMIRIGLHSGSIGAGIYGSDKGRPSFDAWGPVVNIAKRLEAYGEEGNVHISKHVRDALGHRFSNQLHMILRETVLEGIKGIEDGECSYIVPVKAADSTQVLLPEKFLQLVGFQRAKYARWKIANEETERRLAELQKASR